MKFSHLHTHTQYSLLDGASSIASLYQKAIEDDMPAIAITDHGNMFGTFEFLAEAKRHNNKVKPIIGCEFYMTEDISVKESVKKQNHQLLLAKNQKGYENLLMLSHFSYTDGFYRKPLIDKKMLARHCEGIIATSCCLAAMVPQAFLKKGPQEAEKELQWWLALFGEDYYIELQRHQLEEQERLNVFLIHMSKKYRIPLIATNDSHYTEQKDAAMHEILLCINTGSFMSDPPKKEEPTGMGESVAISTPEGKKITQRFAFPNDNFFFKKSAEMRRLFSDLPEAIDNTNAIVDKIDLLTINKDILLPSFSLPAPFVSQQEYLKHLAMEGLRKRYSVITPEIESRLAFELSVIAKMDYSGYFLIVSDFIKSAKERGVSVGPGRGSAAGSLVAYATGITNIDPIKYNLLFERFLNPERRGMPDIDIDFDDAGRSKVIDYIVEKYGKDQTAQIITFNKMGARNAIKDVARVLEFPFSDANFLSQLASSKIPIKRQLRAPISGGDDALDNNYGLSPQEIERIQELRKRYEQNEGEKKILDIASELDGGIRNVGVHAAGIIIAPQKAQTLIPVCAVKDNPMLVAQIEGKYIEEAGIIKMDILGLSNLNQIQTTLALIKKRHNIDIDIDAIPLDDPATFDLYQKGDTVGTFQFESDGMRKYLRDLKPDRFEDLIALNALYRPGPIKYIPEYIQRKQGSRKIAYDLPIMEDILRETYGIAIYQEQVMLLAQKLADFSKGDADTLRKAMGKKQRSILDKMYLQFVEGASANGHPKDKIEKIWKDWESFAQYAFNKSHSTCYALLAYQTAYLKANYPYEFMTSLLEGAKDIKGLSKLIKEAQRMNIQVLGPCVNESDIQFSITPKQEIRFGLSSIKGFGRQDGEIILEAREKAPEKKFNDIFHFASLIKGQLGSGKMESLAKSGSLDCFTAVKRAQYFIQNNKNKTFIEELCQYGKLHAEPKAQKHVLLAFDMASIENKKASEPAIPPLGAHDWDHLKMLQEEKEILGTYISRHPLSIYDFEFEKFSFTPLADIEKLMQENKDESEEDFEENASGHSALPSSFMVGGIVESIQYKTSKKGSPYLSLSLSDFSGVYTFTFFGKDYNAIKETAHPNVYVYLLLSYEKDPYRKDRYKLGLKKIGLLENFRKTFGKELHVYIESEHLSPSIRSFFENHLRNNTNGKTHLFFHIKDDALPPINVRVEHPIAFSDELVGFLQTTPKIYSKVISYN